MKYFIFITEKNFIYGYHTQKVDGDFVVEYEGDETFPEFYIQNLGKMYYINGEIIIGIDKDSIHTEIADLKIKLGDTDWKIIVNYERALANLEPKYDIQELILSRQSWRKRINELEELLNE